MCDNHTQLFEVALMVGNKTLHMSDYKLTRRPMITLAALLVSLAGFTTNSKQSNAQNQINSVDRIPVPIAVRNDVLPYVTDNATAGLEIEIINAVFKDTPYAPQFIQLPRMRMIQMFTSGKIEGVLTQNNTLPGKGCITDWYIKHQNVGMTLSNRNIKLGGLQDISNLSIITFDGARKFIGPQFASEARKSPRYIESSDQNIHVSLLYLGYFDLAVGDEWILKLAQLSQKHKSDNFQPLTIHRILPSTLYAARFHEQKVCEAFNASLIRLRESGQYQAVIDRHFNGISAQISIYENEIASTKKQ